MEPSQKSPAMIAFLDHIYDRSAAILNNVCVTCGVEVKGFRDALSKKEYIISGLCQVCQDKVFQEEE